MLAAGTEGRARVQSLFLAVSAFLRSYRGIMDLLVGDTPDPVVTALDSRALHVRPASRSSTPLPCSCRQEIQLHVFCVHAQYDMGLLAACRLPSAKTDSLLMYRLKRFRMLYVFTSVHSSLMTSKVLPS